MNELSEAYAFVSGAGTSLHKYLINSKIIIAVLVGVHVIHAVLGILPKKKPANIEEEKAKHHRDNIIKQTFDQEIAPHFIVGALPVFCQITSIPIVVLYICLIPASVFELICQIYEFEKMKVFARTLMSLILSVELFLILLGGNI